MRRRLFLQSGSSAAVALALQACGGGGGGDPKLAADLAPAAEPTPGPATQAVAAPAAETTAAPAPTKGYPFGSRLERYKFGIQPNHVSQEQMDHTIKSLYDRWKRENVVDVPTVPGGKAVKFGNSTSYLTVSEGMGMGMVLVVLMEGHDPQAREVFDGLLTTVRARPAYSIPDQRARPWLMDWRLVRDGSSTDAAGGGWNAMDGDQDIAMALLMADRQWGSDGKWNYLQEGINTIHAMKYWNMKEDGTTKGLPRSHVSRTSDYMIGHFRAYKKATGDALWDRAVDRSYELINLMQTRFAPGTGLMPDFIIHTDTASPIPSPGGYGDFVDTEGYYYANAQRNPWRYGTDYVCSGDERWKNVLNKLMAFIKQDTGGDPARVSAGYHLNGYAMSRAYSPKGMIGPLLCGAMVDPAHQEFLNRLWTWNTENFTTLYYDSELQLIPLIVASGNWWRP
ncbi:hypothetical protein JI739_06285 [Ramlibacter sp. AW1]|uniref:cellulase n=1 Tax=Ramlibacter aurantiacus TaxID=2801330 RepID=A0A936ZPA8_9BURK|nr:glycosyl hydrolase family 8 [Ramlibacter aurantiacus]MBL0419951.1 hypothetical protein [Ramlibacter aurantiacus]